jgi:hypothetical protein
MSDRPEPQKEPARPDPHEAAAALAEWAEEHEPEPHEEPWC